MGSALAAACGAGNSMIGSTIGAATFCTAILAAARRLSQSFMAPSVLICWRIGTISDFGAFGAVFLGVRDFSGSISLDALGAASSSRDAIPDATDRARSINDDRSISAS